MSLDRRAFLGVAGLSALTVAGTRSLDALTNRGRAEGASETRPAARWAMVVDLRKCLKGGGCTDCIAACDRTHNVPRFESRAHEVKWIWREPFVRAFADHGSPHTEDAFRKQSVPVLCNHFDDPPCVRVCPV
ncbi:MAG: 4Fe-4S ferredoxin, partial [Candidatus Rokubacteria bacterium]|nr:4Fe-4S ferredoxin [Candidatus Rokubacteria bacterium]